MLADTEPRQVRKARRANAHRTAAEATRIRIKRELDAAVDEAERSPMPNPADAAKGLFKGDNYWNA